MMVHLVDVVEQNSIQVGDVTESEFYWTKILKSKVCCPLNFFSKNENIGCY